MYNKVTLESKPVRQYSREKVSNVHRIYDKCDFGEILFFVTVVVAAHAETTVELPVAKVILVTHSGRSCPEFNYLTCVCHLSSSQCADGNRKMPFVLPLSRIR